MIRESPCEAPRWWPRACRSSPMTRSPRRVSCHAAALPSAPRPTTATSYVPGLATLITMPVGGAAEPRQQPAADVEARVLHGRVPALRVEPRRHPPLHGLAGRPVLAVHEVPE